jgi:hypothetical protein
MKSNISFFNQRQRETQPQSAKKMKVVKLKNLRV